jgi:hypothetical protein
MVEHFSERYLCPMASRLSDRVSGQYVLPKLSFLLFSLASICVTIAVHFPLESFCMERKSETLNLRVTPELKELIRLAAEREHRTIGNFIEVLVRQHCAAHEVAVSSK